MESSTAIYISLASAFFSLMSVVVVYFQYAKQRNQFLFENFFKINEINRDIIKLGFQDETFFKVLNGDEVSNKVFESKYLQLWLNQESVAFSSWRAGVLSYEHWLSVKRDLADFFELPSLQNHWLSVRLFYHKDFAAEMDILCAQARAPQTPPTPTVVPSCQWTGRPCSMAKPH